MSDDQTLLPPTSTGIAKAFDLVENRISRLPVGLIAKDPALVDDAMLDALAWEMSVDDWGTAWLPSRKREVLAAAEEVHRHKGTPYGVRQSAKAMGYGDVGVIEGWQIPRLGKPQVTNPAIYAKPLGRLWRLGEAGRALGRPKVGPQRARPLGRGWVLGGADAHVTDYWVSVPVLIFRKEADALATRLRVVAPVRSRLRAIRLEGVFHELGTGVWTLGNNVPLGGVFKYEVTTNG